MKSGIYKLQWPGKNDYFYYGQSINIHKRYKEHKCGFRKNKHRNDRMQKIYNKYGMPDLLIVEFCDTSIINKREQYYIDIYFTNSDCCNICPIAESTRGRKDPPHMLEIKRNRMLGTKRTTPYPEDSRIISSQKKIGSLNGMFGRKITESAKNKQREKICGSKNYLYKPILHVGYGIYYDTLKEAADVIGMERRVLWMHISNKLKKNNTPFVYA